MRHLGRPHRRHRCHQLVRPMRTGGHLADRLGARWSHAHRSHVLHLDMTQNAALGRRATSPSRIVPGLYPRPRCPMADHHGRWLAAARWTFDRARPVGLHQARGSHRCHDRSLRARSIHDWPTHDRSTLARSRCGRASVHLIQNRPNASRLSSTRQLPPMISTNQNSSAASPDRRALVARTPTSRRYKYC